MDDAVDDGIGKFRNGHVEDDEGEAVDEEPAQPELRDIVAGRYFSTDSASPRQRSKTCVRCQGQGHDADRCSAVLCTKCGAINEHSTSRCRRYEAICANCLQPGHDEEECFHRPTKHECLMCHRKDHPTDMCPSIWRQYVLCDPDVDIEVKNIPVYCYSCGKQGHRGEECIQNRRLVTRISSAPRDIVRKYWNAKGQSTIEGYPSEDELEEEGEVEEEENIFERLSMRKRAEHSQYGDTMPKKPKAMKQPQRQPPAFTILPTSSGDRSPRSTTSSAESTRWARGQRHMRGRISRARRR